MTQDDTCPSPEEERPEKTPVPEPAPMPEAGLKKLFPFMDNLPSVPDYDRYSDRDRGGPGDGYMGGGPNGSGPNIGGPTRDGGYGGPGDDRYERDLDGNPIYPGTTRFGDVSPELQDTVRAHRQGEADANAQIYGEDDIITRMDRAPMGPDSRRADWYYDELQEKYRGMSPDEVRDKAFNDSIAEHERMKERIERQKAQNEQMGQPSPDAGTDKDVSEGPGGSGQETETKLLRSPERKYLQEPVTPDDKPESPSKCFDNLPVASLPPLGKQVTLASDDAQNNTPNKTGGRDTQQIA